MSLRFASEQLADLRHDAQLLIERAGDQEGQLEAAHAAVKGDGDVVWPIVLAAAAHGTLNPLYEAGRVDADRQALSRRLFVARPLNGAGGRAKGRALQASDRYTPSGPRRVEFGSEV